MNSIHSRISELIQGLVDLYRRSNGQEWHSKYILNDVYDLVMQLWASKVIKDVTLMIEILQFYYHFKKYAYIDPTQLSNYAAIEQDANLQLKDIMDELSKI